MAETTSPVQALLSVGDPSTIRLLASFALEQGALSAKEYEQVVEALVELECERRQRVEDAARHLQNSTAANSRVASPGS